MNRLISNTIEKTENLKKRNTINIQPIDLPSEKAGDRNSVPL